MTARVVAPDRWPGGRALATSPLADVATLNLAAGIGARRATWAFRLVDRVSGMILGDLHPVRQPAVITHDVSRVVKRDVRLALTPADVAAINPISDRIDISMEVGGESYPLGRYVFTDPTSLTSTGGERGLHTLLDEMFIVDQQLEHGFASAAVVSSAALALLAGLPLRDVRIEATEFSAGGASWPAGTPRGQALAALAQLGDYETPWLDHSGVLRMIRSVSPDTAPAALDLDSGARVVRDSIAGTTDILQAPNRFIVIGSGGASNAAEITGVWDVPASAPHSIANRGFVLPEVTSLQVASATQARAVARGIGLRRAVFRRVDLETAPDPRHDSYDVLNWQGQRWLELAWSMTCADGAPMRHTMRRAIA